MANQLAENSVRTYHLAPEGFKATRNRLLKQKIVLLAGVILFALFLSNKMFGESWRRDSLASFLPTILFLVIISGALAAHMKRLSLVTALPLLAIIAKVVQAIQRLK